MILRARESFRTTPVRERLDTVLNLGLALGDDTLVSLAGLARNELFGEPSIGFGEIQRRASAAGLDLRMEILIKRIRKFSWGSKSNAERTELLRECQNAIRESDPLKIGLAVDLLRSVRAAGEYQIYVELSEELLGRMRRVELRGIEGVQLFSAVSRMNREWPFWGVPPQVLEQLMSLGEIDAIASLSNADMALDVVQLALRIPQPGLRPETLTKIVHRFEDIGYIASASPEAVVDFLRSSNSRRPPLDDIALRLLEHFILPRQLFSMAPETASDLLSMARRGPFRRACRRLCAELENPDWLPREEHSLFWHRLDWERRHHEDLVITALANRSVRLRNELLQTVLSYGSHKLRDRILRESLARTMPANAATGALVLKLAHELEQGEMLLSWIHETEKRRQSTSREGTRGAAQTFMQRFRFDLETTPIAALGDLRWFARLCKDERLAARIEEAVAGAPQLIGEAPPFPTDG